MKLISKLAVASAMFVTACQTAPQNMETELAVESTLEAESIAVAKDMVAAWNDLDVDRIANLFSEDAVLHSMMIEPIHGRETLREHLGALLKNATRLELQLKTVSATGNTVFLERVDDFDVNGKHGAVPVTGVLVIEGGKVTEWREYYDRNELLTEMGVIQPEPDHLATVNQIMDSWKAGNIDGVLAHVAPDVTYYFRVGSEPLKGPDEIRAFLEKFGAGMSNIQWRINRHAQDGDILMVEGADDFVDAKGNRIQIPYMGMFEFENGKIRLWRDYFNPAIGDLTRKGEPVPDHVQALLDE
ncbi:MAG: hypothetical protein CME99_11910 [Hyphomonas sp.]|uniref:nuclear transport factor 2 family protein n=1 Tax=unclassified Hyphomonas TaxID=2630699 RepID=UPI000B7103C3|nr:nuclear transport factor 2 family protein [Hyphomonas sp.]MAH93864.1 hypothetical protein [Hyphomonas sp.]OUX83840.1 MAG: hypothetical protein CBB91_11485 [Hyphomonas sp. TMED31]